MFYSFCSEYARTPADLDDLCGGILCMRARSRIHEIYTEER